MSDWLLVVLLTLASYRATRLVVKDGIWQKTRESWQLKLEKHKEAKTGVHLEKVWQSKLAYLIGCPWCTGVWMSAIIVLITTRFTSVPLPVLVWAAISSVVGFLAELEPDE